MKQKPGPKPKEKPFAHVLMQYYDFVKYDQVRMDIVIDHGNGATVNDICKAARKAILEYAKQHNK